MQTTGTFPGLNVGLTRRVAATRPASNPLAAPRTLAKLTPNPVRKKTRPTLTAGAPPAANAFGALQQLTANALRPR